MYETKPLSDFYADLFKDRRVKVEFKRVFGPRAKKVIDALVSGEVAESVLCPEDILHDLLNDEAETVGEILGAAGDDDVVEIRIWKFRNVYWITTLESHVGYFDTELEAACYLTHNWGPAINALADRRNEEE